MVGIPAVCPRAEPIHPRVCVSRKATIVRWLSVLVLMIALAACGTPPSGDTAASSSPAAASPSAAPTSPETSAAPEASPAASASPDSSPAASPAASEAASPAEAKDVYAVGDTADLDGIKVTLNEVTVQEPTQFFKPDPGKKFLIADVTVENTTSAEVSISSALQMDLQDDTGQTYTIDIMATAARNQNSEQTPDGTIPAGEKLRGNIGYQVPEDAAGLRWIYKEVFGSGRVVFNVNP